MPGQSKNRGGGSTALFRSPIQHLNACGLGPRILREEGSSKKIAEAERLSVSGGAVPRLPHPFGGGTGRWMHPGHSQDKRNPAGVLPTRDAVPGNILSAELYIHARTWGVSRLPLVIDHARSIVFLALVPRIEPPPSQAPGIHQADFHSASRRLWGGDAVGLPARSHWLPKGHYA